MNAKIVCIGDELLLGQTINTNAAWMGQTLFQNGIQVRESVTISDTKQAIVKSLLDIDGINLVLITGGLGPTFDDITKQVLTDFFETELVLNKEVLAGIEAYFEQRGLKMLESNVRQAYLPALATALPNPIGTASGMWFEKDGVIYVSMPGVPSEMKKLMNEQVIPRLKKRFSLPALYNKTILTQGIGESFLVELIKTWQDELLAAGLKLAYLPSAGRVKIRVGFVGENLASVKQEVETWVEKLYDLIPNYIYGENLEKIEEVVGELLAEKNKTVATAESCTGGYLAHLLTSIPGSSTYFKGSVVAYDNSIKQQFLQVSESDIEKHGAVSEPVVVAMAKSVREQFKVDCGIAFSGIAGPDGGTEEKPVGTVWMALASENEVFTKKLKLGNERMKNIIKASETGLNYLRLKLLETNN